MDDLVDLAMRWAARLNEAEDEEDNRIGAVIDALLDRIEAQDAEIRSLRAQVAAYEKGLLELLAGGVDKSDYPESLWSLMLALCGIEQDKTT